MRSFELAAEVFTEAHEGAGRHDTIDTPFHGTSAKRVTGARALVLGDPSGWPDDPPMPALYLLSIEPADDDADGAGSEADAWSDPAAFSREMNFGGVLGTWNARGEAKYAILEGGGFVAEVELHQDQAEDDLFDEGGSGDHVDFLLATWPVEEGMAIAVLRTDDRDLVVKMAGLAAWPERWDTIDVDYGE